MGKVVDVTLKLIDQMTSPLNTMGSSLKQSANQWTKAGKQIESVGKTITNVGKTLTTAITVPVVTLAATAVTSFGEVDETLRLVESTMGDTAWATADLESAIKTAASSSVFSMDEATEATLNFARQGYNAAEAAEMLTPALSLAAGTETDLSNVTSGLGNALKVFSDQGLTASQAADILAKAQAQANTTTDELFSAMSTGASIFNTVGWSMQDLAAVTDVFGDNSISGSEGMTAMKTGLAKLVSPTSEASAWLDKLGVSVTNADGTMKSMVDVQSDLHGAFADLTQEEQMQAASAIFGKNQMSKWLTLINTAPDTVQGYRDALDDATGTADDMADSLLSGVGGSIEKLQSTFDVFKYTLGDLVSGYVKPLIDNATGLLDKFNNMDPAMQQNIVKWVGIAAAVGPALLVFGKTVTVVGRVVSKVGALGKAIKGFGSVMGIITSPAGIVVAVLAGIVVAVILVIKYWDKIKATAQKVFGYVKKVFNQVGGSSDTLKAKIAPVGEKFALVGDKLKELWTAVKPILKKIGEAVKLYFEVYIGAAIGAAVGYFETMFDSATKIVSSLLTVFGGLIDFITGVFTGNWSKAWEGIKEIFGGAFDALVTLCKTPINAVISIINGAIAGINKLGITVPDWVPLIGGNAFSINIPTIPTLAAGTDNWKGGLVQISERGGEIVDLPSGSRVYPHDKSVQQAYSDGASSGNLSLNISKLADQITVREDADIDKIVDKLADKLEKISLNLGGADIGYIY